MRKSQALKQFFDGSVEAAASEIGVSRQAVHAWPEELPTRISDRIEAVLWRRHLRASTQSALERSPEPSTRGE